MTPGGWSKEFPSQEARWGKSPNAFGYGEGTIEIPIVDPVDAGWKYLNYTVWATSDLGTTAASTDDYGSVQMFPAGTIHLPRMFEAGDIWGAIADFSAEDGPAFSGQQDVISGYLDAEGIADFFILSSLDPSQIPHVTAFRFGFC